MLKKIVWYWNLMHYNVYQGFNSFFRLINYINPISYIDKVPYIKRFYEKKGISDFKAFVGDIASNPKSGFNRLQAGALMVGLSVLLVFGAFNCSQILFTISLGDLVLKNGTSENLFNLFLVTTSLLFNYFTLFKGSKCLKYFKEFDEMDASEKTKYYWISLVVVLSIMTFFIYSFKFTR
ncbi:MAG: hypothetical protein JWP37_787 [Mucilaginibacter sp.]|nr:hypothetical protein [Mucilaginibacter sp.]